VSSHLQINLSRISTTPHNRATLPHTLPESISAGGTSTTASSAVPFEGKNEGKLIWSMTPEPHKHWQMKINENTRCD
jgi:hypothetical protein